MRPGGRVPIDHIPLTFPVQPMNSLAGSLLFLFLVVIAVEMLKPVRRKKRDWREPHLDEASAPARYRRRQVARKPFKIQHISRPLMTPTEKRFFRQLQTVGADQGFLVAPQVAMSAIVTIPHEFNVNRYARANRGVFDKKRLDFVLLDAESLDAVLVIELDDPSHDGREEEDAKRDELVESAGYVVLHVDVREQLSLDELAEVIAEACGS